MAKSNSAQSLVELLIGIGLMIIMMITATALLQFLLRMSMQDPVAHGGGFLGYETMRSVTALADASWPAVASASGGGAYHVATSTTGFVLVAGPATTTINGVSYAVSIRVEPVNRSTTNEISTTGTNDPSTKKIITTVSWGGGGSAQAVLESYVARTRNEVIVQTDWVGGPTAVCDGTVAVQGGAVTTQLCTASVGIDYKSMPGVIKILGL